MLIRNQRIPIFLIITQYLFEALDNNDQICCIHISQAFNWVDHGILLDKLYDYGFNNDALLLIKLYLTERKYFVLQYINFTYISSQFGGSAGLQYGTFPIPIIHLRYL